MAILEVTHTELIESGYKWLMRRCAFAFKDLKTSNSETPDVLGFTGDFTFLLEAKSSRSDFLADKKKPFRLDPASGIGDFRFFIAPTGLLSVDDLPENWGLLEVNINGTACTKFNPFGRGNIYSSWFRHLKNKEAENRVMYSALRRLQKKDLIKEIYNENGKR